MRRKGKGIAQLCRWTFIILAGLSVWSCDAEDDSAPVDPTQTLERVIRNQPDLSLFSTALELVNLSGTLRNQNLSFTAFAPTNEAFTTFLQAEGFSSLEEVPLSVLEPLMRYHISLGNRAESSLDSVLLNTLADKRVFAYRSGDNILLNRGIAISRSNLKANNGMLHILNEVLVPPSLSLAGLVAAGAADGEYTLLQAALERADLTDLLNNADQRLTFFAPTDAAFAAAGYATPESIENEEIAVIRNILLHHLLRGYRFTHMLRSGNFRSLQGDSLTIDASTKTIMGNGNTQSAQILSDQQDQYTTNGVLHGIDAVLRP